MGITIGEGVRMSPDRIAVPARQRYAFGCMSFVRSRQDRLPQVSGRNLQSGDTFVLNPQVSEGGIWPNEVAHHV